MEILRPFVEQLVEPALVELGVVGDHWRNMIAPSREKSMGDLSLPCFAFAKQLGMAPDVVAKELQSRIPQTNEITDINSTADNNNHKIGDLLILPYNSLEGGISHKLNYNNDYSYILLEENLP